jgi:hypothetical protein
MATISVCQQVDVEVNVSFQCTCGNNLECYEDKRGEISVFPCEACISSMAYSKAPELFSGHWYDVYSQMHQGGARNVLVS